MAVGRQSPADAEPVGARLFLDDAPAAFGSMLLFPQARDEGIPEDAGFDPDQPAFCVQAENALQSAGVQSNASGKELLPARGVATAHHAEAFPGIGRRGNHSLELPKRPRRFDAGNEGKVEPGMNVVENHFAILIHKRCYLLPVEPASVCLRIVGDDSAGE